MQFIRNNYYFLCLAESQDLCTIQEVRVNPCKEAVNNLPCRLKKELDAQISFNYTASEYVNYLLNNDFLNYWKKEILL